MTDLTTCLWFDGNAREAATFYTSIFPDINLSMGEIQLTILEDFLIGITTLKGHQLLNKYKNLND